MFDNFPIVATLSIADNDELNLKVEGIQEIYNTGITLDLFYSLVATMRNGLSAYNQRNEFSIEEWVEFFDNQFRPILVERDQLLPMFNYLIHNTVGVLGLNGEEYFTVHNEAIDFNNKFAVEIIIFRTLELQ